MKTLIACEDILTLHCTHPNQENQLFGQLQISL